MKSAAIALVLLSVFSIIAQSRGDFRLSSPFGWTCTNGVCNKVEIDGVHKHMSLATCKLTCGDFGALWPKPKQAVLSKDVVYFNINDVSHNLICQPTVCNLLEEAVDIWKSNIESYMEALDETMSNTNDGFSNQHKINIDITIENDKISLLLNTNESYSMSIDTVDQESRVTILAETFFGGRHALETLSQLVNYDDHADSLQMVTSATISDSPAYTHRGILLDTSRNFFTVEHIKRTLDAMSANKLNTFHWHMTDSHSFPLMLSSLPQMAYYGAYSSRQVYYPQDIKDIVKYATVRGIKILPELDIPAHVGNGWQWGPKYGLGDLAVCVNQDPWTEFCLEPPCGQLNIANDKIYDVLSRIFEELVSIFQPMELFHFGGDEISVHCWNSSDEISSWMVGKGNDLSDDDYFKEWNTFQQNVQTSFDSANGQDTLSILWTSHLTEEGKVDKYLDPKKNIIQIWTEHNSTVIKDLLDNGYKVIFSNYDAWYFDCGVGAWVGDGPSNWCSPYKGWQIVYNNSLSEMAEGHDDLVLGGEAALWTEQADHTSLDAKLWPRGAALAERLWSNPSESWEAAETRLIHHRQRLVERGIGADRLQPQWCHQNEGKCVL